MSGVRRVVSCRRICDPETPELQTSLLKPQLSGERCIIPTLSAALRAIHHWELECPS